jgi:cytochrome c biogenesis protein ResB
MINNLFTIVIYLLLIVLVYCLIKTVFHLITEKKMDSETYFQLQENIIKAQHTLQDNKEKIKILEELHTTLFNRCFKITRDIILMQKLIFEIHIK